MKILVFYRPQSDHATPTESFLRDLQRLHGVEPEKIQIIDIDSREGVSQASLYDIIAYPGIVVVDNTGAYIKSWSGELPLMDELMSYAFTHTE